MAYGYFHSIKSIWESFFRLLSVSDSSCIPSFYNFIQLVINKNKRRLNLWRCAWAAFFLWLGTLLIFFAYLQYTIQQNTEAQPAAAIIVLGSGIEKWTTFTHFKTTPRCRCHIC